MIFLLQSLAADSASTTGSSSGSFISDVTSDLSMLITLSILFVLLGVAIFIYIERSRTIRKANADTENFMREVRSLVLGGDIQRALLLCESRNDPFAMMIHKGITRLKSGASLKDIEGSIENVGNLEVYRLERRLPILASIAGASPMIGFLGTVIGMIQAFQEIVNTGGKASATELSGGISTAMYTTAGGLIVGVIAYLAYNFLTSGINRVVFKLELTSNDFIDLLQEPAAN